MNTFIFFSKIVRNDIRISMKRESKWKSEINGEVSLMEIANSEGVQQVCSFEWINNEFKIIIDLK